MNPDEQQEGETLGEFAVRKYRPRMNTMTPEEESRLLARAQERYESDSPAPEPATPETIIQEEFDKWMMTEEGQAAFMRAWEDVTEKEIYG